MGYAQLNGLSKIVTGVREKLVELKVLIWRKLCMGFCVDTALKRSI